MTNPARLDVVFRPIGIIHTNFGQQNGTPIQAAMADAEIGTIDVFPEFQEGLRDLDGFSHVIVLYHLHHIKTWALRVRPYLDDREHGIFATRSPKRPNPIGLSVVRLERIVEGRLFFRGADMLDGTPVLDLKPYVPEFDHRSAERVGWFETAARRAESRVVADDRFVETLTVEGGRITAVCLSAATGTAKHPVAAGEFVAGQGLRDDGHAGTVRQVSVLMAESVARFNAATGLEAGPGDFAENLQTTGFDLAAVKIGDRLRVGEALLEVTQIGKEVLPPHYSFHGNRLLPTEGVFCRVLAGGLVMAGTPIVRYES